MLIRNIIKIIIAPLNIVKNQRYNFIISKLFKKRIDKQKIKQHLQAEQPKYYRIMDEDQIEQQQDQKHNFVQRRMQMDTNVDFIKQKNQASNFIPKDIGKGGFQQVVYWSQNAKTYDQITQILIAFNKVKVPATINDQIHVDQFKINSHAILLQYALFGFYYKISTQQFWQKIQFKTIKIPYNNNQSITYIIDIAFLMSQFKYGQYIYNHIQQLLISNKLNIDQIVKLSLIYFHHKKGKKQWIDKLIHSFEESVFQANQEQLSEMLPALKQVKKIPQSLNQKIQKKIFQLIDTFNFNQILNICAYFGFDQGSKQMWQALQKHTVIKLEGKTLSAKKITNIIHKILLSYKFSLPFIRKYILQTIKNNKYQILHYLKPRTLSALSKGLYIYQLQKQTKEIQVQIQKLLISKITKGINELQDDEMIEVIKDYNLTRHGNRQLYIFFEEVIKVKYINSYVPQLNRNVIEILISIYQNSGMCSENMFRCLKGLL